MNLEDRVTALEKAVTSFDARPNEDLTALVYKIIQAFYQSSVFSQLQEKLRED